MISIVSFYPVYSLDALSCKQNEGIHPTCRNQSRKGKYALSASHISRKSAVVSFILSLHYFPSERLHWTDIPFVLLFLHWHRKRFEWPKLYAPS